MVRKKLKKQNRDKFNELYIRNNLTFTRGRSKKNKYIYRNPSTVRYVAVGASTYEESVFRCLTRHTLVDTIREYFVSSDDYNVNGEINANGWNDFIAGRFVFSEGFADKLILVALAEETGQSLVKGSERVEKFYIDQRDEGHEPGKRLLIFSNHVSSFENFSRQYVTVERPEFDPVCSLSIPKKLRLCTIVIGSSELRDQYRFEPQDVFIEHTCVRKEISFRTERGLEATSRKVYREWMIGCKPQSLENLYQHELLYISRGYAANCAYVHKFVFGFLHLHYFVDNVSILRA